MAIIPIAQRLANIERQGQALRRRIERMESDRDFLVDSILNRPWAEVEAQRRLVKEWDEEIDRMGLDLQFLRNEWKRLSDIHDKNHKSQIINHKSKRV